MPKVTDYELERIEDEYVENTQKFKKKVKKQKEQKYSGKKDYRAEWRIREKLEQLENFED